MSDTTPLEVRDTSPAESATALQPAGESAALAPDKESADHRAAASTPSGEVFSPVAPHPNPAVQRCCAAYHSALAGGRARGLDSLDRNLAALEAYAQAMPHLTDRESVRDFIACAAHGMVLGTIDDIHGTRLLYAAQVALASLGSARKEPKAA